MTLLHISEPLRSPSVSTESPLFGGCVLDGLSLLQGCATEWPPGHMAVKKCLLEACFLQATPLEGRRMGVGEIINV